MKRLAPGLVLALLVALAGAGLAALYGQAQGLLGLDQHGALAFAAFLIALVTAGLLALIAALVQTPSRNAHARSDARRRARQDALTRGYIALGGGDPAQARRWAAAADQGGPAHPLSRLLAAWAAEADDDLTGAAAAYESLLEHPEARVAALRGLMLIARRRKDEAMALAHAATAYALPSPPAWAWRALFDAQVRTGDSTGALSLLDEAKERRILSQDSVEALREVLYAAPDGRIDRVTVEQAMRSGH